MQVMLAEAGLIKTNTYCPLLRRELMKIVSPQIYLQITARIQDHKNEKSVHIDEYLDNIIMDIGDLKERKLINKRA